MAQAYLGPCLMELYGDVEHTGFYEKVRCVSVSSPLCVWCGVVCVPLCPSRLIPPDATSRRAQASSRDCSS
jgi:hypothetical protein